MKIELDCLPCLLQQAINITRMTTTNREKIKTIIAGSSQIIANFEYDHTTPELSRQMNNLIKKELQVEDPYEDFKREHIQLALSNFPLVQKMVQKADDPLEAALIISAIGNSIDAGISLKVNVTKAIEEGLAGSFTVSELDEFKEKLKKSKHLLIIADNSGEGVFDKLLLEVLKDYPVEITYAVREEPILNDITLKEAKEIGIDKLARLISSGSTVPGTLLKETSPQFNEALARADLIISKGQGNYETLSDSKLGIYFLLKAKCPIIANRFNVPVDSLVFKREN